MCIIQVHICFMPLMNLATENKYHYGCVHMLTNESELRATKQPTSQPAYIMRLCHFSSCELSVARKSGWRCKCSGEKKKTQNNFPYSIQSPRSSHTLFITLFGFQFCFAPNIHLTWSCATTKKKPETMRAFISTSLIPSSLTLYLDIYSHFGAAAAAASFSLQ